MCPLPMNRGAEVLNRGGRRKRLEIGGGGGFILHAQGGGGDTSMITYSAENGPSYQFFCLLGCLFSAFLNACMLSFGVKMIKNELCTLMFSHQCFIRLRSIFFLAWLIRAAVGSTSNLVHGIIFSSSCLLFRPCRNYAEIGTEWPKCPKLSSRAKKGRTSEKNDSPLTGLMTPRFG